MAMRLIVITSSKIMQEESELLVRLFEEGLECLHLRKPDSTEEETERLLISIPEEYHGRIVLHDHFRLAEKYGVGGLHVNRRNPNVEDSLRTDGRTVSRSCHSLDELKEERERYDYCFLSPIFDSISKCGYRSAYSGQELKQASEEGLLDGNVIALGGIRAENIGEVASYGFGGVAVLGDLWNRKEEDLIRHFRQLTALCS